MVDLTVITVDHDIYTILPLKLVPKAFPTEVNASGLDQSGLKAYLPLPRNTIASAPNR